ncbi:MAG: glycosyltransferase [Pseudomonadota bacterium]
MSVKVSLVIPLFNEARCLEANVGRVAAYLASCHREWELLLVNDGSTDTSAAIARRLAGDHDRIRLIDSGVNRGKGHAVRTGMMLAQGERRLFMDADLAVPIEFAGRIFDRLAQGDPVVIGSRHLEASALRIREGALRQFMGAVYRRIILWGFGLPVSDITCGLKGFSAAAAADIFSRARIDRWGYDAELLFIAKKLGYAVAEVPVDWYHSFDSAVRVGRDSLVTILETVQIWQNHLLGRYRIP